MHLGELSVFVDESGKPTLGDVDSDPWYVLVAVIVKSSELTEVHQCLADVATEHFAGNQVKSSTIKGNDQRRLQVLEALCAAPWTYVSVAVRKSEVYETSGLRFKPVFHKFMSRMLIEHLRLTGSAVRIRQDTYGTEAFMSASLEYMQDRVEPDLWFSVDHGFATPAAEPGIQLADFIAGSLRRWMLADGERSVTAAAIRSLLRSRMVLETSWPAIDGPGATAGPQDAGDAEVQAHLLRTTRSVADALSRGESLEEQQMSAVLDLLGYVRLFEPEGQRASTAGELMAMLTRMGIPCPTDPVFRATVMGGLRDRGVIVAGNRSGYRLALDLADVDVYLQHTGNVLMPMLHRLQAARTTIMAADPYFPARMSERHGRLAAILDTYLDRVARE